MTGFSILRLLVAFLGLMSLASMTLAGDLAEIRKAGAPCRMAIPYASFYADRGDGLEVGLIQGISISLPKAPGLVCLSGTDSRHA